MNTEKSSVPTYMKDLEDILYVLDEDKRLEMTRYVHLVEMKKRSSWEFFRIIHKIINRVNTSEPTNIKLPVVILYLLDKAKLPEMTSYSHSVENKRHESWEFWWISRTILNSGKPSVLTKIKALKISCTFQIILNSSKWPDMRRILDNRTYNS